MIDTAAYLERIGFDGPVQHDVATLEALQRAHMTAVPFENLHVFHRRGVRTDAAWSVPKVLSGRGGWCFELNGAFAALLSGLGFSVTRLAARVVLDGKPPEGPDHLTLRIDLDEPYLVDVGFGDSFIRPLRLDDRGEQDGGTGPYRLRRNGPWIVMENAEEWEWRSNFQFNLAPHGLYEFDARSRYLQTQPELRWTAGPFATRLLDGGPDRVWLLHDRLKFRRHGKVTTVPVAAGKWSAMLGKWFGMDDRRRRDAAPNEVVAVVDHEPPQREPLHVEVGDQVRIGKRDTDWPAFVFIACERGEGWMPASHLSMTDDGLGVVKVAYDTTELAASSGDRLAVVVRDDESGWLWCRNEQGAEGWVPARTMMPAPALTHDVSSTAVQ